jgi:hypothetical protein
VSANTGFFYGSVEWSLVIDDLTKGTVTGVYANGRNVLNATSTAAINLFDEYYRNPGSSSAP